jgi:hypothetical protein
MEPVWNPYGTPMEQQACNRLATRPQQAISGPTAIGALPTQFGDRSPML